MLIYPRQTHGTPIFFWNCIRLLGMFLVLPFHHCLDRLLTPLWMPQDPSLWTNGGTGINAKNCTCHPREMCSERGFILQDFMHSEDPTRNMLFLVRKQRFDMILDQAQLAA